MLKNWPFFPSFFLGDDESFNTREFDTFNASVDEFFSQMESQKIDMKVAQQEKQAMKKLENIKKDHESRLQSLESEQEKDRKCGELIELNSTLGTFLNHVDIFHVFGAFSNFLTILKHFELCSFLCNFCYFNQNMYTI